MSKRFLCGVTSKDDYLLELTKILETVGHNNIWRPVCGPGNILLADGIGAWRDAPPESLKKINFEGNTVVDLGCNFGYYSFLVKKYGATHVTGVDIETQVIKGCQRLKDLFVD